MCMQWRVAINIVLGIHIHVLVFQQVATNVQMFLGTCNDERCVAIHISHIHIDLLVLQQLTDNVQGAMEACMAKRRPTIIIWVIHITSL